MSARATFELCPKCGFSIFIVLRGDVRQCINRNCRHEWTPAPPARIPDFDIGSGAAVEEKSDAAKGGAA